MGRYATACERLGVPGARPFYDVHVVADVHHAVLAMEDLAGGLAEAEPALVSDVALGARAVMTTESRFARGLLDAWAAGRSSLLAGSAATTP